MNNYTHPVIKGVAHKKMLPKGTALVLEGGGTRGFYSAGVFEAFMDEGIMFPYIAGVSAGAANAMTYIAGQPKRNRTIVEKYVGDKKYVSFGNMLRHRSLFGYDYIFKTIPQKHIFWDKDIFDTTDIRFVVGTIDCATGETIWFEKNEINLDEGLNVLIASCSIPLLARIVRHKGFELLDGGVSAPIPIEKSIADGNTFHVIVLTRNPGYIKESFRHTGLMKLFYRKYPKIVEAVMNRHEVYNRQLKLCEQLEREKKAIIIRPQIPLSLGRSAADTVKLLELYDEGHSDGREALQKLASVIL